MFKSISKFFLILISIGLFFLTLVKTLNFLSNNTKYGENIKRFTKFLDVNSANEDQDENEEDVDSKTAKKRKYITLS